MSRLRTPARPKPRNISPAASNSPVSAPFAVLAVRPLFLQARRSRAICDRCRLTTRYVDYVRSWADSHSRITAILRYFCGMRYALSCNMACSYGTTGHGNRDGRLWVCELVPSMEMVPMASSANRSPHAVLLQSGSGLYRAATHHQSLRGLLNHGPLRTRCWYKAVQAH